MHQVLLTRNSSGDEIANVNFFTTTSSTTSKQRAPEANEFGEIIQNKGHYAVQSQRFWYQWKLHTGIWLLISELTSYLAPFSRYSLRSVQNHYICLPFLHLTPRWRGSLYHIIICNISLPQVPLLRLTPPPTEGFPCDDLRIIFRGCQWIAKLPNAIETLPKISTGWVGCINVTDRRQVQPHYLSAMKAHKT